MKKRSNKSNELAQQVIGRLKAESFTIQRYDAFSTNSIYLKLDYGVCNSLRISDHKGKDHLDYRYNLLTHIEKFNRELSSNGYIRYYFPEFMLEDLINRILTDRHAEITQHGLGIYTQRMRHNKRANRDRKGFWRESKLICEGLNI